MKSLVLVLTFALLTYFSKGQISSDFEADTTKACAPYQIQFTDLSTGPNAITSWQWDFGNSGFSNLKNPSRVYTVPGKYTVTLTVSDGVNSDTKVYTQYIEIFKSPVADFSFSLLSNCKPLPVNFTDSSALGDAPILSYAWDYGDLTPFGNSSASSHTYNFNGTYSVFLTIVDTNGCTSTSNPKNISVDAPESIFTGTPRAACVPPLNVQFNNFSTGKAPLSFAWKFGNGSTSTFPNTASNYTLPGSYDVELITTDANGCSDTLVKKKYVSIGKTVAVFNFPDTVCINSLGDTLNNESTGATTYLWSFSNGGSSNLEEPVVSFNQEGNVTITLIASAGTNCADTLSKTIYVEKITSDFVITYDSICSPHFVSFKDSSLGNVKTSNYHLDMGPSQIDVYKTGLTASHSYLKSYCKSEYYLVNHEVITNNGCKSVKTKAVEIFNDRLTGFVNMGVPCVPATVSFGVSHCLRFKPVSWKWNFNTGNPADTSNLQNPPNTFSVTQAGRHFASVLVTDSVGCKYSHNVPYEVGEKQTASFQFPSDTICYADTVTFINTSNDTSKIDAYSWDFGDSYFGKTFEPSHPYTQLGRLQVRLWVSSFGCEDSTSRFLYVSGPRVSIGSVSDCANRFNQTLKGHVIGGYNWFSWNFGDGSPNDSSNINVSHTYTAPNRYNVSLVAFNDTTQCKDSITFIIDANPVVAYFDPVPATVCQNSIVQFDAIGSQGNINGQYFWNFGDGSTRSYERKPKHKFTKSGTFTVELIVFSLDSCSDTTSTIIDVSGIHPNFNVPGNVCGNDSLLLLDLSTPDTSITSYQWRLDNQLIWTSDSLGFKFNVDSSLLDTSRLYNADTIRFSLVLRDVFGCRDSAIQNVIIHDLKALYSVTDSTLCINDEVIFTDDRLPSNANHVWYFGNGDSSKTIEPRYTYTQSGIFNSQYIVSANNCSDTGIVPIVVQTVDSVRFSASITDTNCYPATIYFDDYSTGDSISWRTWDFGDGIVPIRSPLKDSLTKTFLYPGQFTVKVIVETSNGCLDSITYQNYIHIKGPYSQFSVYPDTLCKYDEITFVHDTSNVYSKILTWDFADGRVDTTDVNVDTLKHKYGTARKILAILLFEDSLGTCRKFYSQEVLIEEVLADFSFNPDSIGCVPFKASFKDNSTLGNQWNWDFGDNEKSNAQDPIHTFNSPGKFEVKLVYENSVNQCKDTVSREVNVLPLPIVNGFGDTSICVGDSARLYSNGARFYQWAPRNYVDSFQIQNPKAAPQENQLFKVFGVDSNQCVNSDDVWVVVQQIPEVVLPSDQVIIIGEEFEIVPNSKNGTVYRWEPSTGLSCSDCPNPIAQPLENTTYTLYLSDSLGCFEAIQYFTIEVQPKFSVDVPEMFTPNGDGINDVISPNGWGIKSVLEFKVFNRWGELLFEATPQQPGWDGYYKGNLQNIETYVYYVKVISYEDEVISKEGFFSIVR
ncbi:MAG: PKD domain-containing protein [Salibacteraceae bacterium]